MAEDIELGIDPYPLNETESRLITLLFTLRKSPSGLTYEMIRRYMKDHYNNDNLESDQKKLHRDMEELGKLGFPAYVQKEDNTYHVKFQSDETKFKFSPEELQLVSQALIHQIPDDKLTSDVYSLAQKIFGSNWNLYPDWNLPHNTKESETNESEEIVEIILFCIKTKIPIKIQYERKYGKSESKELDPIQLIKKNSNDFYLYAYDRNKLDYRNYLIPCIRKVYKLESSFIKDHKPTRSFENLHPLMIPKNPLAKVELEVSPNHKFNWENYLSGLTYHKENTKYYLEIYNLDALFTYLLKNESFFVSINPQGIKDFYIKFLDNIADSHAIA